MSTSQHKFFHIIASMPQKVKSLHSNVNISNLNGLENTVQQPQWLVEYQSDARYIYIHVRIIYTVFHVLQTQYMYVLQMQYLLPQTHVCSCMNTHFIAKKTGKAPCRLALEFRTKCKRVQLSFVSADKPSCEYVCELYMYMYLASKWYCTCTCMYTNCGLTNSTVSSSAMETASSPSSARHLAYLSTSSHRQDVFLACRRNRCFSSSLATGRWREYIELTFTNFFFNTVFN